MDSSLGYQARYTWVAVGVVSKHTGREGDVIPGQPWVSIDVVSRCHGGVVSKHTGRRQRVGNTDIQG